MKLSCCPNFGLFVLSPMAPEPIHTVAPFLTRQPPHSTFVLPALSERLVGMKLELRDSFWDRSPFSSVPPLQNS